MNPLPDRPSVTAFGGILSLQTLSVLEIDLTCFIACEISSSSSSPISESDGPEKSGLGTTSRYLRVGADRPVDSGPCSFTVDGRTRRYLVEPDSCGHRRSPTLERCEWKEH
ncbi:hypothetical protein HG530_004998 [Fusarium avenaceum]|nr:hypothetical protein HG530_004998 [Fusarium avenaceum]